MGFMATTADNLAGKVDLFSPEVIADRRYRPRVSTAEALDWKHTAGPAGLQVFGGGRFFLGEFPHRLPTHHRIWLLGGVSA